ncbi:hypothetical protein GO755_38030 [Spirosoma sp. HMF4905]|uniref:Uncharacterized protein n=1 Tax=Spirosoma arboris TaxID=2682092 RepID=A0A7K1SQK4_9BACT|nr:hypothetical protein [Spirosoma arboris]MVM35876.1 hypothetical protein [Spirosoma arboris]
MNESELTKGGFIIVSPPPEDFVQGEPDWFREKKWIEETVHSFLVKADDDASEAIRLFKCRLALEQSPINPSSRIILFEEYRKEILERHRQLNPQSLFTDHWQKKGGYSEEMLIGLAHSVRMRYLNMGGFEKAGEVIMQLYRVYFSYFLILQLNDLQKMELASLKSPEVYDESTLTEANKKSSVLVQSPNAKQGTVTQAQLALFYFYCHQKDSLPPFPSGKLVQAYKDATAPYNLAWKPFQQHYNRFKKRANRLAESNRKALLEAIKMLQDYPEVLELAKDDLKVAQTRNPIT